MNPQNNIPVMIVFSIAAAVAVIAIMSSNLPHQPEAQLKVTLITSALGGLIAVLAGVLLLFRAVSGRGPRALLPLLFPLFAGLLILHAHWALALAVGALGIAVIVQEILAARGASDPPPNP